VKPVFQNRVIEKANNDPTKYVVGIPGHPGVYVVIDLDEKMRQAISETRSNRSQQRRWGPFQMLLEPVP
jgi:hypothetical protein